MYAQIKAQIIKQIMASELPTGFVLPSDRKLANDLKVNRSTVIRAYQELKAEGFIDSKVGSGTFVLQQANGHTVDSNAYIPPIRWDQQLKMISQSTESNRIKGMLADALKNKIISFAGGLPGEDLVNINLFTRLSEELHRSEGANLYGASPVDGIQKLKKELCNHMAKRNVNCNPSNILVTSGSQQGLSYITRLLVEPGDVVLTEEPTYLGALNIFEGSGARTIGIPLCSDGIDTSVLETYIFKYRPKLIYVQPNFQNPKGVTMSYEKRKALLDVAYRYKVPIIEDDIYSDLRYEGDEIPPLKALDNSNYVIYLSSFSKILSFGMRIGWICADQDVIRATELMKQMTDLQSQTLGQYMIARILEKNHYQDEIVRIKKIYIRKRNTMIKALKKYPELFEPTISQGGFFIWVRLPDNTNMRTLETESVKRGVAIVSGDVFYPKGVSSECAIRLSFSSPKISDIEKGIEQLADAIRASQIHQNKPIKKTGNQPIV